MNKISEEELKQIQSIKQDALSVASTLGELVYQKVWLEEQIESERKKVLEIQNRESELFQVFRAKYGNVVINIETGEFN